jgi:hypothetical protein
VLVSVTNHGFLASNKVFHLVADRAKISDIVSKYPELDIAIVRLTLAHLNRFSNQFYF